MTKQSVFLSYSSRDSDVAARLARALERLGLHAFTPEREIGADDNWRKSVQAAIKRAHALILLVSTPQSAASSWTSYEAGMAEALGKPILVLLPSKYPVTELSADVATGQVVDFDPNVPERAAREIANRLVAA